MDGAVPCSGCDAGAPEDEVLARQQPQQAKDQERSPQVCERLAVKGAGQGLVKAGRRQHI